MMSDPVGETFFVAGGTLKASTPSYVKRPADDELFEAVMSGQLCYVLTPRQMGKSSLMTRTSRHLEEHGIRTASIDLTGIGTKVTAQQWYTSIISQLNRRLNLGVNVQDWFKQQEGVAYVQVLTTFIEEIILERIEGRVVVFIDEIDSTLQLNFRDDFFAGLRAIYNARTDKPAFDRITFVLLGVASPSDLIADRTRTPFNIGHAIALQEFDFTHASVLQDGLNEIYPEQGEKILKRIFFWTNGHPYLTQKLCSEIVERKHELWIDSDVDELVNELFLSEQARKETNLKFVQDRLLDNSKRSALLRLYKRILREKVKEDAQSAEQNELKLSGLVRTEDSFLKVRNLIYKTVFSTRWAEENIPKNWARITAITFAVLFFALFSILAFDFVVGNLSNQYARDVFTSRTTGYRLQRLAEIFELKGILSGDYDFRARELFYNLTWEQQIDLFTDPSVSPEQKQKFLIPVIRGLYVTMANMPNSQDSSELLEAMSASLNEVDSNESQELQQEINLWLAARLAGNSQDAIDKYDQAIVLDADNPSILYERARIALQLGKYEKALQDLDMVMALAQNISTEENEAPTQIPDLTETVTPLVSNPTNDITSLATTPFAVPSTQVPETGTTVPATVLAQQTSPSIPLLSTPQPTPIPYGSGVPYRSNFISIASIRSSIASLINDAMGNLNFYEFTASLPETSYPNLNSAGIVWKAPQQSLKEKLVIVVASFDGQEETYQMRNSIIDRLNSDFGDDNNISIISSSDVIKQVQSAQQLGEKLNADFIIWGRYSVVENTNIDMQISIESVVPGRLLPISQSIPIKFTVPTSQLQSFEAQQQIGQLISPLVPFLAGYIQYQDGNYSSAIAYFDKSLSQSQESASQIVRTSLIYFYRGGSNFSLQNYELAIADYNRAIEYDPEYADAYIYRGITYNALGQFDSALESYQRALQLDPNNSEANLRLGDTYSSVAQFEQALQYYNKAIELEPSNVEAFISRGSLYYVMKEYDPSRADFTRAIELDPTALEAYAGRASVYSALGDSDRAIQDYNKVIELDPNYYGVIVSRQVDIRTGCYEEFPSIAEIPAGGKVTLLLNEREFDTLGRECVRVKYQEANEAIVAWALLQELSPTLSTTPTVAVTQPATKQPDTEVAFDCPLAPPVRLHVGDIARTAFVDGAPTRVRSAPEVGANIINSLTEGAVFKIIGGPICSPRPGLEDAFVFWQIDEDSTSLQGWIAEGDKDSYYIEPLKASQVSLNLASSLSGGVAPVTINFSAENSSVTYEDGTSKSCAIANCEYKWVFPDGVVYEFPSASSIPFKFTRSGTFDVSLTVCSGEVCSSMTQTITIK